MGTVFRLEIECELTQVRFTLHDGDGRQLGANEVRLADQPASKWRGVLDTRAWIDGSSRTLGEARARLQELGCYLGEALLGPEILGALAGSAARTLAIRTVGAEPLATSLRRVPWEIARAATGGSLRERNVVTRQLVGPWTASTPETVSLAPGEAIRILLVFAEAPGTRPLAMRLEREAILEMMFREVFPHRLVKVNVLCHGVTRRRIRERILETGGFHVIHWSGHGRENALELTQDPGDPSTILTGDELVQLICEAGGFTPQLMFLSSCRSGAADGTSTGVAAALLGAGVNQVVAMRYDVGDAYARRLARAFYRRLLIDEAHHSTEQALALARIHVASDRARQLEYHVVDHETPAMFGGPPLRLVPYHERSPQMDLHRPRPYPLLVSGSKDLDPPDNFVGRGAELAYLYRQWFDVRTAPRVTVIRGLAGMGKTAMAAEMIHLWHAAFDLVLCFQSKGRPLGLDELYLDLDRQLELASASYRQRCAAHANERVYLTPAALLTGRARYERMANNLLLAMDSERVLLVLDNFETNLDAKGPAGYRARDPEWDLLLQVLARELPSTPGSRVIVTTRHRLAAFAELADRVILVTLSPLVDDDALIFFQGVPALNALWTSDDPIEANLAMRVLSVSCGHPLLLRCFGGLASKGTGELTAALDALQQAGYDAAPAALASGAASPELVTYLREVMQTALDELIARLGWETRRLLWVLARIEGSLPRDLLPQMWSIARREASSPIDPVVDELLGTGLVTLQHDVFTTHPLSHERVDAWMASHAEDASGLTPAEIDGTAGRLLFEQFVALEGVVPAEVATELGRRALRLLARGQRWDLVGQLANHVATAAHGVVANALIADLSAMIDEIPEAARSLPRTGLARALQNVGRVDEALVAYELADREAGAQQHDGLRPDGATAGSAAESGHAPAAPVKMTLAMVHFMDEQEHALVRQMMPAAHFAESFCVGEMSAEDHVKLQASGMVVEDLPDADSLESAAPVARGGAPLQRSYRLATRGPLLGDGHVLLEQHGVEIMERAAGGVLRVRMPDRAEGAVRALRFVRGLSASDPVPPGPPDGPVAKGGIELITGAATRPYTVQVSAPGVTALLSWLASNGIVVLQGSGQRIRIEATEDQADAVRARVAEVAWVEPYEPPRLHCDLAYEILGIQAVAAAPLGLTGTGELIAIADTGLDTSHPDFQGRVDRVIARGRVNNTSDPHGHGTHVAGTAVGDGSRSNGAVRGVAPAARLVFQSLLDDKGELGGIPEPLDALFDEAYLSGARIHLDSWGTTSRSTYTLASGDVDRYVYSHKDFLVVLSAGNAGSNAANTIGPPNEIEWATLDAPATCKNAIVVGASQSSRRVGGYADRTYNDVFPGRFPNPPSRDERVSGDPEAVAAFSSRGPTDDRRIKPDLVAPGTDVLAARSALAPDASFAGTRPGLDGYAFMSGTSMAAPFVAGSATLVREYYRRIRGHAPSAALIKATLINGTRWLQSPGATATPGGRPNFHQGFGALHIATCLPRDGSNEHLAFIDDVDLGLEEAAWFEADILGDTELRICLAWTDPPARAVQNNLDLLCMVTPATGPRAMFIGNADLAQRVTRLDVDNNVEVIRIPTPAAGRLRINVTAKSFVKRNDRQDFALVVLGSLVGPLKRVGR